MTLDLGRVRTQVSGAAPTPQLDISGETAVNRALEGAAVKLEQLERRRADVFASKAISEAKIQWTKNAFEREQNAEGAAEGHAQGLKADYQKYLAEQVENAPRYARDRIQIALSEFGGRLEIDAMGFEAQKSLEHRASTIDEIAQNSANMVISNPGMFAELAVDYEEAVEGAGLPGDLAKEARANGLDLLANSALKARIDQDPRGVLREVKGGDWDEFLQPNGKLRLMDQASAEIKRQEAEARARAAAAQRQYLGGYKDTLAYLRAGNTLPAGSAYNYQTLRSHLGDDRAKLAWEELQEAQKYGADYNAMSDGPAAARDVIQSRMDLLNDNDPEGFAQQQADLQRLLTARRDFETKLVKDPAQTALQSSEYLKRLYADMDAAEAGSEEYMIASQEYFAAMDAEQERLGLNEGARMPLPANGAKQTVANIMAVPEGEKPAAINAFFDAIPADVEEKVRRQLKGAGLNATTAAMVDYRDDPFALAKLATASAVDPKEAKTWLESGVGTEMKDSIRSEMADLETVLVDGSGAAGIEEMNRLYTIAERIGVAELRSNGGDANDAAQTAAKVLLDRMEIFEGSNIRGIIMEDDGVTIDQVEDYADDMLEVDALRSFIAPPGEGSDDLAVLDYYRREREFQTGDWVWVNEPGFRGFELHVTSEDGIKTPVMNGAGQRYRFTTQDVRDGVREFNSGLDDTDAFLGRAR